MSLPQLIGRLERIEQTASGLFEDLFDGVENDHITWVVKPLNQVAVSNIHTWFGMTKSDLTAEVLQGLFHVFMGKRPVGWQNTSLLSPVASRLQAVAESLQEGSKTWERLCEARQEVYLAPGRMNREEFWRYRAFTEKTKDCLLKQVASARINLQEINDLIEHFKEGHEAFESNIPCPITGHLCDLPNVANSKQVFVAFQFSSSHFKATSLKVMIAEALGKLDLIPFFPDEHFEPVHISCEICHTLQQGSVCIFEISDSNPNVMFELGIAYMLGKFTILLSKRGSPGTQISDIAGIHRIEYDDLVDCRETITRYLKDSAKLQKILGM